jgi:hypothetical protein
MSNGKKNRKLINIFINKPFQTKIIILVVGTVLMQSLINIGFLYLKFRQFLEVETLANCDSGSIFLAFELLQKDIMTGIIVTSIEFIIFAAILATYFSHKMAGPNYAIKRAINNLLDGVEHHKISLRKGDEFHELADKINTIFSEFDLVKKDKEE